MTQLTKELLEEIVRYAVLDSTFRQMLKSVIANNTRQISIDLSDLDVEELRRMLPDIERFGALQGLDSDDAKTWTIGLFEITDRKVRPRRKPPVPR